MTPEEQAKFREAMRRVVAALESRPRRLRRRLEPERRVKIKCGPAFREYAAVKFSYLPDGVVLRD